MEGFKRHTYSKDGGLQPFNKTRLTHSCYYHGEVEGVPDSLLAVSTCHGLRGVLHMGEEHYGIEPIESSMQGEHRLFQLQEPSALSMCGVGDADTHSSQLLLPMYYELRRKKRAVLAVTSFVELGVVVDNLRYKSKNSNMTAVEEETLQLVNIVDGMFRPLNIRIVVTNLLVWTQENPIDVNTGTAGDVLGRFSNWRDGTKGLQRTDISHLLIGRGSYGGVVGMAFVGTVCSPSLSSSISSFSPGSTPSSFATVVAHELGHNLGMSHDDTRCSDASYVMYSADRGAKTFSSCSSDDFEGLILRGGGLCLKNPPDPNQVLSIPVCGNNVVDKGEECDCGSPQECKNPCCNAATCRLTSGSQCAQGLCCENCKFKVGGMLCREKSNTCDLPEYCNGSYALCPVDVYVMNGFPCNNSYCYSGVCQSFDSQCETLFGAATSKGVDECFRQANLAGDRYGNCGVSGSSFVKCAVADSLCGKLQCTGTPEPILTGQVSTFYVDSKYKCVSVDFNLGTDVPDPGLVHQGTACGDGKACVNNKCANASLLGYNCDVKTKCNDHGICNNNGNCHCNYGWAPPYCDRSGYGGSIDSGPTHIDTSLRDGLLIFFLLVLPLLILIVVAVIKRDAIRRRCCGRRRRRRGGNEQTPAQNNNANRNVPKSQRSQPQNTFPDVFTISHNVPNRQPIPNGNREPPLRPPLRPPPPPSRPSPSQPATTPQYYWNPNV
ncbi:disintegrin and metalloproteinase domain-containing protein 9-like isoform 2-T2 [Discoglossus pictus]